jgi:16S rRNA G966 N2-methylase RsmD
MATNNFLFYGDNLEVLRKSVKDESVDLCYIDPPFNSQSVMGHNLCPRSGQFFSH